MSQYYELCRKVQIRVRDWLLVLSDKGYDDEEIKKSYWHLVRSIGVDTGFSKKKIDEYISLYGWRVNNDGVLIRDDV